MALSKPDETLTELNFDQFFALLSREWKQGEHVLLIGQTGSGKTSLARDILVIRDYVVVLAVKRNDDTMDSFNKQAGYIRIKSWPPNYDQHRVLIWLRPDHLDTVHTQAARVYRILDDVFHNGGWAAFVDDLGYMTGTLKLSAAITVLYNQARSSHVSMVGALTQASSVVARVPSETLRQAGHVMCFPYHNERDIKAIAMIVGFDWQFIKRIMARLQPHDFLYFHHNSMMVVHYTR